MSGWAARGEFVVPSAIFDQTPKPFEDPYHRRCLRLYRMVAILHGLGFQGLRIHPYLYPLGYRTELFPSIHAASDGIRVHTDTRLVETNGPHGSALRLLTSGGLTAEQLNAPRDASLSARQMAVLFIKAYPALAGASYHLDYAYAGWFTALLGHCEFGQLPYLFSEYEEELGVLRFLHVEGADRGGLMPHFPLPPTQSSGVRLQPPAHAPWSPSK